MKIRLYMAACGLLSLLSSAAIAATSTGTINATLTLTSGCLVNGESAATGVNFGTLDFGTSAATFSTLNATLVGSKGNGISIKCTTDQSYNVQLSSSNGVPDTVYGSISAQPRYLLLGKDATKGIAYTLYSSTAYTTPIANNTNLVISGTSDPTNGDNYPIYGRITGGNFNTAIPAGTYTDTINVVVNY
ncbi:Spore coat protein U (SCPU) domain-containing protein [Izhakiella capsodis]|uniref:Spore coat protein U (SCPU) domain-containing protein n=1 Tax=Izhakiella capsodis TaxID=1367852 RepID=A0A1I4VY79_9GAMM|nr:spore coat U domain-containing protein [Izhakiella capsodis]SFN06191.1 Spore coat protein U (SCPU) domain-containing protein [Izhakiella capsodis]